jgi:hypothetical protein
MLSKIISVLKNIFMDDSVAKAYKEDIRKLIDEIVPMIDTFLEIEDYYMRFGRISACNVSIDQHKDSYDSYKEVAKTLAAVMKYAGLKINDYSTYYIFKEFKEHAYEILNNDKYLINIRDNLKRILPAMKQFYDCFKEDKMLDMIVDEIYTNLMEAGYKPKDITDIENYLKNRFKKDDYKKYCNDNKESGLGIEDLVAGYIVYSNLSAAADNDKDSYKADHDSLKNIYDSNGDFIGEYIDNVDKHETYHNNSSYSDSNSNYSDYSDSNYDDSYSSSNFSSYSSDSSCE